MSKPRRNVELKASDPNPALSARRCSELGAEQQGEILQRDTYFDSPRGGLKLREERPGGPHLIQFDRADEPGPRESRYRTVGVPDAAATIAALRAALGVRVTVVKRRQLFLWREVRIHLDQVDGLGSFIELEAVASSDSDLLPEFAMIDHLKEMLGIADERLTGLGYADLLLRLDRRPAQQLSGLRW
jgi:adenylate cyclase, class 2